MNFDKESISEDFFSSFFLFFFWGGGRKGGGVGRVPTKNIKYNSYLLFLHSCMLYIKFQVPGSSGSLVLTQTKGVTDRKGT